MDGADASFYLDGDLPSSVVVSTAFLYTGVSARACARVRSSLFVTGGGDGTLFSLLWQGCNESYLSASTFGAPFVPLFGPDT